MLYTIVFLSHNLGRYAYIRLRIAQRKRRQIEWGALFCIGVLMVYCVCCLIGLLMHSEREFNADLRKRIIAIVAAAYFFDIVFLMAITYVWIWLDNYMESIAEYELFGNGPTGTTTRFSASG